MVKVVKFYDFGYVFVILCCGIEEMVGGGVVVKFCD